MKEDEGGVDQLIVRKKKDASSKRLGVPDRFRDLEPKDRSRLVQQVIKNEER